MGKRSDFERKPRDYYRTWDPRAVRALAPHLKAETRFVEPMAGDGVLADQLTALGHVCAAMWDIEPQRSDIAQADALTRLVGNLDCFITNPAWRRDLLHAAIVHLSDQAPTWLLFDADWVHTKQAIPLLPRLRKVVSIGRLRWEEGTAMDGKDNCAWHLFDRPLLGQAAAEFYGRAA